MIFHSGSTVSSMCWHVLISGGFSLDLSQLLVSTLRSFDISPFSLVSTYLSRSILLLIRDTDSPPCQRENHLCGQHLDAKRMRLLFFWTWWQVSLTISVRKGGQLCLPGQFSSCLCAQAAPGVASPLATCWSQQSWRPLLDPIRSWPYLDFEDNLTLELLIVENDRLSVIGKPWGEAFQNVPWMSAGCGAGLPAWRSSVCLLLKSSLARLSRFVSLPENPRRKSCVCGSPWQPS